MNQVKVTCSLDQSRFTMLSWSMARNSIMRLTKKMCCTALLGSKSNLQTRTVLLEYFVILDM